MSEASIRQALTARLRWQAIPDPYWEFLVARGSIRDHELTGEPDLESLAGELRLLVRHVGDPVGASPARGSVDVPAYAGRDVNVSSQLRPDEERRARVFSELLVAEAGQSAAVSTVRERLLDGSLLDLPDAIGWLRSPTARLLQTCQLAERGIPIAGHTITFLTEATESGAIQIRVEPGGCEYTIPDRPASAYEDLDYPDGQGGAASIRYAYRSPAWEIAQAVRTVTRAFPWTAAQTVGFILCGMPPLVLPLRIRPGWRIGQAEMVSGDPGGIIEHAQITVVAEPWISAETIEGLYRDVQRRMLGRENRQLSGRGLDVLSFCLARPQLSTRDRMREWNAQEPGRQYDDVRNFARDCAQAERRLRRPAYRIS